MVDTSFHRNQQTHPYSTIPRSQQKSHMSWPCAHALVAASLGAAQKHMMGPAPALKGSSGNTAAGRSTYSSLQADKGAMPQKRDDKRLPRPYER